MNKKLFFSLIITIYFQVNNAKLIIRNLENDPMLILKKSETRIQIGITKICYPLNLRQLKDNINTIFESTENFLNASECVQEGSKLIIELKKKKIIQLFNYIQPIRRSSKQKRALEFLGTGLKWLTGVADSTDKKIITKNFKQLAAAHSRELEVNLYLLNKVNESAAYFTEVKNTVNNLVHETQLMYLIFDMDQCIELLNDIKLAINYAKIGLVNNNFLPHELIESIKENIINQNVDIQNAEEAFSFVEAKIAVNGDYLYYILDIPVFEEEISANMELYPVIVDNEIIENIPSNIIINGKKLYITKTPNKPVQRQKDIIEYKDACITPIIKKESGKRIGNCTSASDSGFIAKLVDWNKVLISNAKNDKLYASCGHDTILNGNFMVEFEDCAIRIRDHPFESTTLYPKAQSYLFNVYLKNAQMNRIIKSEMSPTKDFKQTKVNVQEFEENEIPWYIYAVAGYLVFITVIILCK